MLRDDCWYNLKKTRLSWSLVPFPLPKQVPWSWLTHLVPDWGEAQGKHQRYHLQPGAWAHLRDPGAGQEWTGWRHVFRHHHCHHQRYPYSAVSLMWGLEMHTDTTHFPTMMYLCDVVLTFGTIDSHAGLVRVTRAQSYGSYFCFLVQSMKTESESI